MITHEMFEKMDDKDKIRALRQAMGLSQVAFSKRFHIPLRTVQNWEEGVTKPRAYIIKLLEEIFKGGSL